MIKQGSTHK